MSRTKLRGCLKIEDILRVEFHVAGKTLCSRLQLPRCFVILCETKRFGLCLDVRVIFFDISAYQHSLGKEHVAEAQIYAFRFSSLIARNYNIILLTIALSCNHILSPDAFKTLKVDVFLLNTAEVNIQTHGRSLLNFGALVIRFFDSQLGIT